MILKDKVILITGASSGIGYSLSKLLAKENCKLALAARRVELLEDLKNSINNKTNVITLKCDVSNQPEVVGTFNKIMDSFGRIDIAILNAGVGNRASIEDYSSAKAEETIGTNTMGIVYWVEQLLSQFKTRKEGMIVGVSSIADLKGYPKSGFYNASKAAASLLLQSLRIELKPYNVKVVTVRPGFVRTPMTDKNEFHMPFLMNVDKAARIIVKGIKKEKRIIQFPWPIIISEQLIKLMPTALFEWLAGRPLPARRDKLKNE